ncbi:hypothetical protein [Streptomyces sp. WAC06614]|uniref:hypothetical protein n=1 Tax=Streptomyces sp. WAC06614 TaxID=2487416 RepID=UPI000F77CF75|nr:hypothetical protein [Streptomyces sp. WAC06614]RSS81524.1 hypothetical protein EF918_10000 [Streptomyces sp. WAC06614]
MGMTVLYVAFGFVALWLLAEVLLQYKARLRWRLLAFVGFLGVVAGVVLPSVPVIAVGAGAFAIGQTLVTLSFRKGFVAGWALRRDAPDAASAPPAGGRSGGGRSGKRRRGAAPRPPEPALEVTALEYDDDPATAADGAGGPDAERPVAADQVYLPQPMDDDTGSYGIQSFSPTGQGAPHSFAGPEQDAHQYAAYYDPQQQGGYEAGYAYGQQQTYAAYSDPYIGTGGGVAQPYAGYPQYTDPQYATDTPPGGVWVPQQRDVDAPYPAQPQQPQPYPGHDPQQYPYQGSGEYEQYRY